MRIFGISAAAFLLVAAAGGSQAAETSQQKQNLKTVVALYNAEVNDKDVDKLAKYLAPNFKEHDPHQKGDLQGLIEGVGTMKKMMADAHVEILRKFTDGDYVILHGIGHTKPGDLGTVVVEIFRMENGKVAEQWDVAQPVMEKEKSPNKYPMY
jgi:predicted SnoaL-like aldol condensation-catalyzing enzyme